MDIQDWDLDWQDRYQFKKPITLPAGTMLKTKITRQLGQESEPSVR